MGSWFRGLDGAGAAVNELIELAAVEPDSAALRAVVDFDTTTFSNKEGVSIIGTFHTISIADMPCEWQKEKAAPRTDAA